jgi:hypothetical protein
MRLVVSGDASIRVVFLDRAGRPVSDREHATAKELVIDIPAEAIEVAIACLGRAPAVPPTAAGFAAVSFGLAPAGAYAVAGWQTGNVGDLVSVSTVLTRGAAVVLPSAVETTHKSQTATLGAVRISDVVRRQPAAETWLPRSATVVMLILDGQDPTAAAEGDLGIAVDDAVLATPPIPVGGGRRRALLYDVADFTGQRDYFRVSVASRAGWRLAGIAGLKGKAIEWANRFHGDVPERVVPEGPLTPDGSVLVRVVQAGPAGTAAPRGGRGKAAAEKAATRRERPAPRRKR